MLDDVVSDHQNAFLMRRKPGRRKKEESRTIYDEGQVRVSTDEGRTGRPSSTRPPIDARTFDHAP